MKVTPLQLETLRFIADYTERRGFPPSFTDIASHWRIGAPAVHCRITLLAGKGLVERRPHLARTLKLTALGQEVARTGTPIDRTSPHDGGQCPNPVASSSKGDRT